MSLAGSTRSLFFWSILISTFCVVGTAVTFSGVLHAIGRQVACAGAKSIEIDSAPGGAVDPTGPQGSINTTLFEMRCTYPDGTRRTVGNDQLFVSGVLGAAGIGVLLGVAIAVVGWLRRPKPSTS